ncbi:MAG: stage II sporulation protein R [Oscillospiraceae bacterium]|jgi:stage II sporulation protein R|nr:stage II sporulation protein R [Oscillospiraceae bacterium]
MKFRFTKSNNSFSLAARLELAALAAIAAVLLTSAITARAQEELSDKLVRLHVVANSDSDEDQAVKLAVRDEIIGLITPVLESVQSQGGAEEKIGEKLPEIEAAAEAVLAENGFFYGVTAYIAVEDFPTRQYESFSLPAGRYKTLRVVLGSGQGRNWWCVLFPPLCRELAVDYEPSVSPELNELFENSGLTEEQIRLITSEKAGDEYAVRFKFMELIGQISSWFK